MFTKERLDRAVANILFAQWSPQLSVDVLVARSSDHARTIACFLTSAYWQTEKSTGVVSL
jgi:hypothetical protein